MILVKAEKPYNALARIEGDLLIFENEGLSSEGMNEILVGAVALAEHARRRMGDVEVGKLGRIIGEIAGEYGERPKLGRDASSRSSQNWKLRKERRASRSYGRRDGGFAFAGFAAGGYGGGDGGGGGGGGGCDGGGGGGGC